MSETPQELDQSGSAAATEPIDTDFEPVPKTAEAPTTRGGLGWIGAIFIALISGGIGAYGSLFLNTQLAQPASVGAQIDAAVVTKLVDARLEEVGLEPAEGGLTMADIQPMIEGLKTVEGQVSALEAVEQKDIAPQIASAIDANLATALPPLVERLEGLETELTAVNTALAATAQKLDLIEELLGPISGNSAPTAAAVVTSDETVNTDDTNPEGEDTPPADTGDTNPGDEGTPPADTGDEPTNAADTLDVADTDIIPSDTEPTPQTGLAKFANLQRRAQATVLLAKMKLAVSNTTEFAAVRAQIQDIDLPDTELINFLGASETAPPSDMDLLEIAQTLKSTIHATMTTESVTETPTWLDGFIRIKRSEPEQRAALAQVDQLITLTQIGQLDETKAFLDALNPQQKTDYAPYIAALEGRLSYETALAAAQTAMTREVN